MALPSPLYVAFQGLETLFVDKTTGLPLANGYVNFYSDAAITTPKNVYRQVQSAGPTYAFSNIGSTVTLNDAGAFSYGGDDIQVYAYPYDADGDIELYFLQVYSEDNVLQFTRQAQPAGVQAQSGTDTFESSENIISNPQFVLTALPPTNTITYSVTGSATMTQFAPDWYLVTDGIGTVTLTLQDLTDSTVPTQPPFAMRISSASITSLKVRQRITSSPRIAGSGYLSASLVAKSFDASPINLTMTYNASSGYSIQLMNQNTTSAGDYAFLSNSTAAFVSTTSNAAGSTGYVDIDIAIPITRDVGITSVQIATTQTADSVLGFIQESTPRQIDHLYHFAYPIVPIGTVIDYLGFDTPSHYLACDATAINRVTYQQLFRAITITETVSLTSGVSTFTVVSSSKYFIGMPLEGTGVAASTTISNIVGTTITMSNNATSTTSSSVRFFLAGAGDGSTTFNLPDLRGYVTAGWGGTSVFAAGANGIGAKGGASTHAITIAEMPAHTHPGSTMPSFTAAGTSRTSLTSDSTTGSGTSALTIASQGGGTAMSLIQQTALVQKYIRYE